MPTLLRIPATTPQQIHASRLIIATNRGPVEYYLSQNEVLKHRRGPGGVVTALMGAAKHMDVTWVAMAMTEGDRIAIKDAQQQGGVLRSPLHGQNMQLRYVAIPRNAYRKHYEEINRGRKTYGRNGRYPVCRAPLSREPALTGCGAEPRSGARFIAARARRRRVW